MFLTAEQIRYLLNELSYETVHFPTSSFPYRIQKQGSGYKEGMVGQTQTVLSMMLEAKTRAGAK